MSQVYFLLSERTGTVKIGYAKDVRSRRSDIQNGSADKLKLMRVIDGGREMEQWVHKKFASSWVRGEWFDFHEDMLTFIAPDIVRPAEPGKQKWRWVNIGAKLANAHKLGLLTDKEMANIKRRLI